MNGCDEEASRGASEERPVDYDELESPGEERAEYELIRDGAMKERGERDADHDRGQPDQSGDEEQPEKPPYRDDRRGVDRANQPGHDEPGEDGAEEGHGHQDDRRLLVEGHQAGQG